MIKDLDLEIKKTNLYETVAEKLEQMILDDQLKIGEKLPSEQTLGEKFGVSRNIVRESIKILKERGLINVKTGDGAYIVKPKTGILGDMVNRIVAIGDTSFQEVYELRFALEVDACGLAAERVTDEEIAALECIIAQMQENIDDVVQWVSLDWEFHSQIAKATHNPLFRSFIKPLAGTFIDMSKQGYSVKGACKEGIKGHKLITEAIKNRDSKSARKEMMEHLKRSKKDVFSGNK